MSHARLHNFKRCSVSASGHAAMNLEFQSRTIPRRTKYTTIWFPDEIKDLARRLRTRLHERAASA